MRLTFNLLANLAQSLAVWTSIATIGAISSTVHAEEVVVAAPFIELQLFPGRGYPKFHTVEKNQTLRLLKSRVNWYQVVTSDGIEGWVHRRDMHSLRDADGLLLDFSVPSWHETQEAPWQVSLLGGELDSAGAYNVILGYRFTSNISLELKYTQAFGETSNVKLASAAVVHQAFPEWRYSPFFTLGAGVIKTDPDAILVDAEDDQDSVLSVGAGIMIYLNHRIMARIEYNQHTVLTTQDTNQEAKEWKAGLSVLF